jgi:rhodanese-related sulfurtransferase
MQTISPRELADKASNGKPLDLIDVRTPAEFREIHATCARNIPLDSFEPTAVLKSRLAPSDEPLYVICKAGTRTKTACDKLAAAGFANAVQVEGGTTAWAASGLPVVRGEKKAMSLERQVRIAAGSIVLVGCILGWYVYPAFFGLSAFVGAGLVFSGVTDTCGMGMVLAKMPWNA